MFPYWSIYKSYFKNRLKWTPTRSCAEYIYSFFRLLLCTKYIQLYCLPDYKILDEKITYICGRLTKRSFPLPENSSHNKILCPNNDRVRQVIEMRKELNITITLYVGMVYHFAHDFIYYTFLVLEETTAVLWKAPIVYLNKLLRCLRLEWNKINFTVKKYCTSVVKIT